jgi:hypothetical protein
LHSLLLPRSTGLNNVDEDASEHLEVVSEALSGFGSRAGLNQPSNKLDCEESLVDRTRSSLIIGVRVLGVLTHEAPEHGLNESPAELGTSLKYFLEKLGA